MVILVLPPLVLVHGWPQSSYCWHEVATALPEYYIITPDLRGLGDSERTLEVKAYEKHALGEDVFSLLEALGIDEFYLGGHDWGSAVVQEMALLKPEKIKKLVLINMVIINNFEGKRKPVKFWQKACLNLHGTNSFRVFLTFLKPC